MNIGILTFHRAANYGAVLQAYALQNYLKNQKHNVEILDYRCRFMERSHSPLYFFYVNGITNKIKQTIRLPIKFKKRKVFNDFIKRKLILGNEIYDNLEVCIVGSDQVWNSHLTNYDMTYLLANVPNYIKKISYGASIGKNYLDKNVLELYRKYLKSFKKLSVREFEASELLYILFGYKAEIVGDPVFLLKREEWNNFCEEPNRENYLLLYMIRMDNELEQLAKDIAKSKNLQLVHISDSLKRKKNEIYVPFPTPEEWVGLFKKASYVCTNSFHGTAFSLIYNKEACISLSSEVNNGNARIIDLIRNLGIEIPRNNRYISIKNYNWELINKMIEKIRIKSQEFLELD